MSNNVLKFHQQVRKSYQDAQRIPARIADIGIVALEVYKSGWHKNNSLTPQEHEDIFNVCKRYYDG
jgi:hypothetical protein